MVAQITVKLPQLGSAPDPDSPETFDDLADDLVRKLPPLQESIDLFGEQANALAADVNDKALAAANSASAAEQAALTAGAVTWTPGTYALNTARVSPGNQLTYRKRTATSATTIDPKDDPTNWKNISNVGPVAATLADNTTAILWDAGAVQIPTIILTGNRTLAAPTNLQAGVYVLHVKQNATGNFNLTFDAAFVFIEDVAPEIAKGANRRTVFSFICDGTNLYGSYLPGFTK